MRWNSPSSESGTGNVPQLRVENETHISIPCVEGQANDTSEDFRFPLAVEAPRPLFIVSEIVRVFVFFGGGAVRARKSARREDRLSES